MDIKIYTEKFFGIEERLALFEETINGVAWWDAIRHDLFYEVYYKAAGLIRPPNPKMGIVKRLGLFINRTLMRFFLEARISFRTYDTVIFRTPRSMIYRKMRDASLDGIVELIDTRKLVINTYPIYYHRRQSFDKSIIIDKALLIKINQDINKAFGIEIQVVNFIHDRIQSFFSQIKYYRSFFSRCSPKVVLLTQNGIEKGLFLAARRLKIPVIEIQHGLINFIHPAYSYPKNAKYKKLESLPNYLFTYSKFWSSTTFIPIVEKISVGRSRVVDFSIVTLQEPRLDFLVVSADVYDETLRGYVRQLAHKLPNSRIGYKLHPNQRDHEASIRHDLCGLSNVEIFSAESPIAPLLNSTRSIVTIQSTVVYEALQAGKVVFIFRHFDYMTHEDVFHLKQVYLVDTINSINEAALLNSKNNHSEVFFEPLDALKIKQILFTLLGIALPNSLAIVTPPFNEKSEQASLDSS